jgi:molybdopterin-biosynthesis enzyme MoeA-like protein
MDIGVLIIGDEILSGKRQDRHLAHVIETLAARGLDLDYAHYARDDRGRLTALLRETFARGDLLWSFGGIGATPDDHTRQAAAAALGVALLRHPDAVRDIEARFGAEAYPQRVRMAEFPAGSRIIPNPVNGIPGFALRDHQVLPGFPRRAWPMVDWVLANGYPELVCPPRVERAIVVHGVGESQLIPLMDECVARFPRVKLFSLPTFAADGGRRLELGVRGAPADADIALAYLRAGVDAAGHRYEPLSHG